MEEEEKISGIKRENELLNTIAELKMQLKIKNQRLKLTNHKLGNARKNVQRLKNIVAYQRDRIVKLYGEEIGNVAGVLNENIHE